MAGELEVRMNSVLVSGRKDATLTYAEYVKDRATGKTLAEIADGHESRIGVAETKIAGLEKTADTDGTRIGELEGRVSGNEVTLDGHERQLNTLTSELTKTKNSVTRHDTRLSELEEGRTATDARVSANETELADHETRIGAAEKRLTGVKNTVDEHERRIGAVETEQDKQGTRIGELETTTSNHETRIARNSSGLQNLAGTVSEDARRLTAAENDIDSLEAKQKTMQTTVEGHRTTLADHEKRITQAETDIAALKDTVEGMSDYYVAEHDEETGNPLMKNGKGSKELLAAWHPYLIDMTDNTGEVTHPVGRLMDNNFFRFADGSFAPTVGITEEQRAQCDVQLYTDAEATQELTLPNGTVVTAKDGAHPYDAAEVYEALGITSLYDAEGAKVRQLLPWETTERKYTIGIAHDEKLYLVDRQTGTSGATVSGVWRRPTTYDGIDTGRFGLERTALSPSPVAKVGGRLVCLYFDCDAGDAGSKNAAGTGKLCSMYVDGKTYPVTGIVTQITNMQWARSANADAESPVPFAEGGFMAKNTFITCMELLFGTKWLHNKTMFSGGICTNDTTDGEETWRSNGGTRFREQGTETWTYLGMGGTTPFGTAVKTDGTLDKVSWWSYTNGYNAHERTMEAQMAASWATEMGIGAGEEFEAYGTTYRYEDAAGAPTLRDGRMNCRVYILRTGTGQGWKTADEKATYEIEQVLRVGLVEGMNLWGDIFTYEGGGCELLGTSAEAAPTYTAGGYKDKSIDVYLCAEQRNWRYETEIVKSQYGRFGFENAYAKVGTVGPDIPGEGYAKKRIGHTPMKTINAGNLSSWECAYGWTYPYWAATESHVRAGLRLRCYAINGVSGARSANLYNRVSYGNAYYGGSAQCRIG